MLLGSPGKHVRRDGDGLLGAAGLGMPRGLEDFGPAAVQGHRREPQRAVARSLGGPGVMRGAPLPGGAAGQRPGFQQGAGRGRAVQVAVGDDRAFMGALGAAAMGIEVLDELRAGGPERQRPRGGVAVGVAGAGENAAGRDAIFWHPCQDGHQGADGVVAAERDRGAAGEPGKGRSSFAGHRDGGGEVVAEEQLIFAAPQVVLAVSPGGLGIGAGISFSRGRSGE